MIAAYFSRFAPRKLSNLLVGLIIFFSATQLGFHFWPSSTLVYGIRIDYLSPTLYFLDLLIIGDLLFLKLENLSIYDLRLVLPLLLTNLLFSANPLSTLSWSLHLVLYLSFIFTLFSRPAHAGILHLALFLSLFFQTILALAQVALGHSLGGLMYYLGERTISVGSPSIALATFFGSVALRAYATFSHPNVLAGWALVSLLILLRLRKVSSPARSPYSYLPLIFTTILVSLTQSRSAALVLFGFVIPFALLRSWRPRLLYFVLLLTTSYSLLTTSVLSRTIDPPLSERLDLQRIFPSLVPVLKPVSPPIQSLCPIFVYSSPTTIPLPFFCPGLAYLAFWQFYTPCDPIFFIIHYFCFP
ncbi:MAG: hypothetical protein UX64_C0049G0008 [Microgenomates group bacterium GW2011_GWC2_46_7]|nr:MAG: hypothetical protein UX64_C0049G0008 [Microgenomates group bacterium GW2011_GWC2_46_7]